MNHQCQYHLPYCHHLYICFFTESMKRHWIACSTRIATALIKSWCKRRRFECRWRRHTRRTMRKATGRGRQQRQHITLRRQVRMNGQDWQDWDLIKTIKSSRFLPTPISILVGLNAVGNWMARIKMWNDNLNSIHTIYETESVNEQDHLQRVYAVSA